MPHGALTIAIQHLLCDCLISVCSTSKDSRSVGNAPKEVARQAVQHADSRIEENRIVIDWMGQELESMVRNKAHSVSRREVAEVDGVAYAGVRLSTCGPALGNRTRASQATSKLRRRRRLGEVR